MICQPDTYIFSDELEQWCDSGYDFIGAPRVNLHSNNGNIEFIDGENGGFSLRNVSKHLKVLNSFKRYLTNSEILEWYDSFNYKGKISHFPNLIKKILGLENNTFHLLNKYDKNEDIFWSSIAPRLFKWFKVAPPEIASKFSIEKEPEKLLEFNGNLLPFGCHAFQESNFWRNYINF